MSDEIKKEYEIKQSKIKTDTQNKIVIAKKQLKKIYDNIIAINSYNFILYNEYNEQTQIDAKRIDNIIQVINTIYKNLF